MNPKPFYITFYIVMEGNDIWEHQASLGSY
jgi:hypothetical protein